MKTILAIVLLIFAGIANAAERSDGTTTSTTLVVWALMGAACEHGKCDDPATLPPMGLYTTQAVCEQMAASMRQGGKGGKLITYCTAMRVQS